MEILAKAALASVHPSLIVGSQKNPNSILIAAGFEVNLRVATIGADGAYVRLKHTAAPRFNNEVYEFCKSMAEMRNAHLHSGELPFQGRLTDTWESRFWHACEIVLESMDTSLEEWLGGNNAQQPKALIAAAYEAKLAAAKQRIFESAAAFKQDHSKVKDRERLIEESKKVRPRLYADWFRRPLDFYWLEKCPACTAYAIAGGDQIFESLADDQDDAEEGMELVEHGFSTEELHCPTCRLTLRGEEDLAAANIDIEHVEQEEREIQYEPEYGND